MKSEKGITVSSLVVYVIALTIIVGTIATITKYYYGNINKLSSNTSSMEEITKFNTYITEEVNKASNIIYDCNTQNSGENDNYVIFYNANDKDETNPKSGYTQYTFKNKSIYLNKIKICSNIDDCKFEDVSDTNNYKLKVTLTVNGNTKETVYTLKTAK